MKLQKEWKKRLKLCTEGRKIYDKGNKLRAENKKLYVEGNKFWVEGLKLYVEGNKFWTEAILKVYGNIKVEWKNWNEEHQSYECHLENGEVYGF